MARRKAPKSTLGCLFSLMLLPFELIYEIAMSYRPKNSKGAKISRKRKKKWYQ